MTTEYGKRHQIDLNLSLFTLFLLLLVVGAIVRSSLATRLDDFTIDEAYHIAAGVSYVRQADFRINPEHPPLVKLWVGSLMSATGFHLNNIRPFADKTDERNFAEENVYFNNDFDSVQHRARIAMWTLNGLLLVFFAFAVRRTFGPGVALGTLLFLAIDPTVAAHLPVVMTDLPVALLSASAVVLAVPTFEGWALKDLLMCSMALGLALATKHSAPIFLIFLIPTGVALALATPVLRSGDSRFVRFAKLSTVLIAALTVLWAFYLFRYAESNAGHEVFNRPLADKIADVHSPIYRSVLRGMASTHVVPRAYIWGFADTIRAGLEGRNDPITAFGRPYLGTGPRYFFPAMIALKLPIGLGVLVLIGVFVFFKRLVPPTLNLGLAIVLAAALLFLLVLALGSTYAGIRHALPVVVLFSVFGGCAIQWGFSSRWMLLKFVVAAALAVAMISAVPVMRPWEYFNEIIGGTKNGPRYFSDEGVDLCQRGRELAAYYHEVLEPAGEIPLLNYAVNKSEEKARHLDSIGRDKRRDQGSLISPVFTGTILMNAAVLGKRPFWDLADLRRTAPTARFGNLLVFRGTFNCSGILAPNLYMDAVSKIYAEKPDLEEAERLLRQSVLLDPTEFSADISLGNVCVKRGSREDALRAYSDALQHAPNDPELVRSIKEQLRRVSSEPLGQVPELRDPFME